MNDDLSQFEIAIVGMSACFPQAENLDEFWHLIVSGQSAIVNDEKKQAVSGHFFPVSARLKHDDCFDYEFFKMSKHEARQLNPQNRLFLQLAYQALENACCLTADLKGASVGVYASAASNDYFSRLLVEEKIHVEDSRYHQCWMYNSPEFLANWVSYKLNLTGPSMNVSTACSSSLAAVHLACQALLAGDCQVALAGAVNCNSPQKQGYFYEEGMIYSQQGSCRPFDRQADGAVPGSGGGAVALMTLDEAKRMARPIYAVICSSAINNDGSQKVSFAAPSVDRQSAVIRQAIHLAGIKAQNISSVEAHGTATKLGDPIELAALESVFKHTAQSAYCALGAVKANVGHLDNAAGMVGLIKQVLALSQQILPPQIHSDESIVDDSQSPFFINRVAQDWSTLTADVNKFALVSSLGMGGSNVAVVLRNEPVLASDLVQIPSGIYYILSAKSQASLNAYRNKMIDFIMASTPAMRLDISYTLQFRPVYQYSCCLLSIDDDVAVVDECEARQAAQTLSCMAKNTHLPAYCFQLLEIIPPELKQSVSISNEVVLKDQAALVYQAWSKILGDGVYQKLDDFYEVGGDSLKGVQLCRLLSDIYNEVVALEWLDKHLSLGQQQSYQPYRALVKLNDVRQGVKLFFIHPGMAGAESYAVFAQYFGDFVELIGVDSYNRAHLEKPMSSIKRLASYYLSEIKKSQPAGPYFLAGWSLGGLIAMEMACQLKMDDQEVAGLFLLDTHLMKKADLLFYQSNIEDFYQDAVGQVEINTDYLSKNDMLALMRVDARMMLTYEVIPYDGKVLLFKAEQGFHSFSSDDYLGWQNLLPNLSVQLLDANHYTLVSSESAKTIAGLIIKYIEGLYEENYFT